MYSDSVVSPTIETSPISSLTVSIFKALHGILLKILPDCSSKKSTTTTTTTMSLTAGSYCGNISTTLVDKNVESLRPNVTSILDAAGYVNDTAAENILLNAISYYGRERVAAWKASGETQDAY